MANNKGGKGDHANKKKDMPTTPELTGSDFKGKKNRTLIRMPKKVSRHSS